jgi:Domain of unknown function (DUF5671)
MNEKLQTFLRHARGKGLDYATIRTLLLAAGWKERDIASAIANDGLELPVPEPRGAHGACDAFLYLLTFAMLYITVSSMIALYFNYLNYLFPDPADIHWNIDAVLEGVRYAIAAIVIGFPLFAVLTVILERAVLREPDSQVPAIRKWLTYLTVFLAAAITVGDVITLLFYFLNGAYTTRFILKTVVLLVIVQVVLCYYFFARRPTATSKQPIGLRKFASVAGLVLVVGSVLLGFAMAGSPVTARKRRLDEKRVDDLRAIHQTIQEMTTKTDRNTKTVTVIRTLPKTLDEVAAFRRTKEAGRKLDLVDPRTGAKYAYTITAERTYELCATFELERDQKRDLFWNHPAGEYCYRFDAGSPP